MPQIVQARPGRVRGAPHAEPFGQPPERAIQCCVADATAVHAIEAATFAIPWSLQSFEEEMTRNACARYLVAQTPTGDIIGFAGVWVVIDEGHITNIAVRKDYRGQGIGRLLTAGLMQYAANLGVIYMTLEVRRSNETAQNLFQCKP